LAAFFSQNTLTYSMVQYPPQGNRKRKAPQTPCNRAQRWTPHGRNDDLGMEDAARQASFNFVSEKRSFADSDRALILATGFYGCTAPKDAKVKLNISSS
jgi:putative SOS response-associated peptidase YedK